MKIPKIAPNNSTVCKFFSMQSNKINLFQTGGTAVVACTVCKGCTLLVLVGGVVTPGGMAFVPLNAEIKKLINVIMNTPYMVNLDKLSADLTSFVRLRL